MNGKGGPIFLLGLAAIIFILGIKGSYKLLPIWKNVDSNNVTTVIDGIVKSQSSSSVFGPVQNPTTTGPK